MKLIDILTKSGVVDGELARYFTGRGGGVDTVIVNGAAEPLLEHKSWLLWKEPRKIVAGLKALMEGCGAKQGVIALKKGRPEALARLEAAVTQKGRITVFLLDDFYPAGDRLVLVHEVSGRVVPEGRSPIDAGCLVVDPETVYDISYAVGEEGAITTRTLTCAGEVERPAVVVAHIGTSIAEVLALCGGSTVEDPVVLVGGPVTGRVMTDLEAPVTKSTEGIIVLSKDHIVVQGRTRPLEHVIKRAKSVCGTCTICTDLCPQFLLGYDIRPHLIMRQVCYGIDQPQEVIVNALLCSGCGLCEMYACTAGLSPRMVNEHVRRSLNGQGYAQESDVRTVAARREAAVRDMSGYRRIPDERITDRLMLNRYMGRLVRRDMGADAVRTDSVRTDPVRVEILMRQDQGAQAVPVVSWGDRVREGGLIAEVREGAFRTAVHSSIDGRVTFIDPERVIVERQ
ncbi:MAG: SLBB domain-containing protein [Spirochaetes bacterium]|nr:SLBB domain-containing protein [Spirochaetota bacterium]